MKIEIIRVEETAGGTIGVMLIESVAFCVTLEPPYINNRRNLSCIPEGVYLVEMVASPKYGHTFEVKDVPGRNHVLFHSGNTAKDTMGCILLGQYFDKLKGNRAVVNSGATFKRFLDIMKGESFALHIRSI